MEHAQKMKHFQEIGALSDEILAQGPLVHTANVLDLPACCWYIVVQKRRITNAAASADAMMDRNTAHYCCALILEP